MISNMKYRLRTVEAQIKQALAVMPVVFLNGPRQAGKSTLVKHLAESFLDADYVTLDDASTLAAAAGDPEGFLRRFTKPVIVDEIQIVPELFRVLKMLVDEYRSHKSEMASGQFLLTGSANVMALPDLADALVGRMAVLSLYPFSTSEVLGHGMPILNGWFDQDIATRTHPRNPRNKISFADIVRNATFPAVAGTDRRTTAIWFDGYLTTLLQRDVRQLAEIEKVPALPNIVKILAARAGGLLNDADCARDAKLNAMTYRRYRILLQQLFLISLIPPWFRNSGKRLVKSPKLYFTDTALMCHQLGVEPGMLEGRNPAAFGRVLENFVASELMKQTAMIPDGTLYHYRTNDNREVDFVIERRNGHIIGIEVKASDSVSTEDFSGLKILKEQSGTDFRRGIVLYRGRDTIPFAGDMVALPLENLWSFNMNVTPEPEIHRAWQLSDAYIFWAKYGDCTRVRCVISREVIDDHFHDNASEEQATAAIRQHWNTVWTIFERKIRDGQIEIVHHDHGPGFIAGRHQDIRQVTLDPADFGYRDFRTKV